MSTASETIKRLRAELVRLAEENLKLRAELADALRRAQEPKPR